MMGPRNKHCIGRIVRLVLARGWWLWKVRPRLEWKARNQRRVAWKVAKWIFEVEETRGKEENGHSVYLGGK